MRKGLLSSVATALVGAGSALAQSPYYLPDEGWRAPSGQASGVPALLSADPAPPPAAAPAAPPTWSGGSTGLVPGVDCLPDAIAQHDKFWVEVSYLLAWIKDGPAPGPLAVVTPVGAPLVGPGTAVAIGNGDIEYDYQSGGRVTAGMWFGCDTDVGFEASGFLLERTSVNQALGSTGAAGTTAALLRPFIDADAGGAFGAIVVGGPGVAGGIASQASTRFWGAEGNFLFNWRNDSQRRTDILAGFTYYDLREVIGVSSVATAAAAGAAPATLALSDAIDTRNQFYGGQVGVRTTMTRGRLSLVGTSKIALGWTHEVVNRFGSSSLAFAGGAPVGAGTGFLTQTSNRGRVTDDRFAVALPSNMTLYYQVTDHLSAFVGYDFVYLSRVARPGDQVDLVTQTNAAGAAVRPLGGIHVDDFWMNAFQVGVQFRF
jgi:hypothetical protein